jgi:hypothetical protein
MGEADDRPDGSEDPEELAVVLPPIDHRTGHRRTLTTTVAVHEEFQPRVLEEGGGGSRTPHILLPVCGVRCDWNEGQNFGPVGLVRLGTAAEPVPDFGPRLAVGTVGRVDVNGWVIPRIPQTVILGPAILDLRLNDGELIRARVQADSPAEALPDGPDVLWRRASILVFRNYGSPSGHRNASPRALPQDDIGHSRTSCSVALCQQGASG